MQLIDPRAVLFSGTFIYAISAVAMAILWYQNRKKFSDISLWLVHYVMHAAGYLLVALRGIVPDFMSIVIGNTMIMAGMIVLFIGLERFVGKTRSQVHNYLLLAVFTLVQIYFGFIQPDLAVRIFNFSLVGLIISVQCMWLMLRRVDPGRRHLTRNVGRVFFCYSLICIVRILAIFALQWGNDLLKSGTFDILLVFAYQLLLILLTFSLALLVNGYLMMEVEVQAVERERFTLNQGEHIKELNCLYGISLLVETSGDSWEKLLQSIVKLIPPAWQYPERTCVRINLEGQMFSTDNFKESPNKQTRDILAYGVPVGVMEVYCIDAKGETGEHKFRPEEYTLLNAITERLGRIMERKRADEALKNSEERFRLIYEKSPMGMGFINPEGILVDCNDALVKIIGTPKSKLIGFNMKSDMKNGSMKASLEEAFSGTVGVFEGDYTSVTSSRNLKLRAIYAPLFNYNGTFRGVQLLTEDITERRQAERNLALMSFALDRVGEEIYLVDEQAHIIYANKEASRALGYSSNELLALKVADIDPDYLMEQWQAHWQELKKSGSTWFESRHQTKDGRIYPVEIFANYFEYEGCGYNMGLARDITERKRAEDELHRREFELKESQRVGQIGSWDWDAITDSIVWSPEYYRIYNIDPNQPTPNYLDHLKIYTHESAEMLDKAVAKAMQTGESYELELELAHPAPERKWIYARGEAKHDAQGQIIGLRGIAQNITSRKLSEDALRQSERKKTILNRIAGIFLTIQDEEMYREVLSVVLQEMQSKFGIFGFIDDKQDLIIPSLTREIWSECQVPDKSIIFPPTSWGESVWGKAIREKQAYLSNGPFQAPEGHIPIDTFLTVPIVFGSETIGLVSVANKNQGYNKDDQELLESIAASISPILKARLQRDKQEKQRRQAEASLRQSESFIRNIFEAIDEGFVVIDRQYRIVSANKAFCGFRKFPEEQILGQPCYKISHGYDRPCFEKGEDCAVKQTFDTGKTHVVLHTGVSVGGDRLYVEIKSYPIIDETGQVVSVIETITDVTGKRKLEEQFRQAQKMEAIGLLAGGIAHDFNNILGAIIGYANLTEMKLGAGDPLRKYLKQISSATEKAANLTKGLLAFSRKQVMNPKPTDLNDIIRDVEKLLLRVIGEDVELKTLFTEKDLTIMADSGQIQQVLMNLCTNARDAMPDGGFLTVETKHVELDDRFIKLHNYGKVGSYALISVSDTGMGMDKSTIERIFEPFFTTKEKEKGTGLGLSTAYGIIKQHDGYINAYSEVGHGTTFTIYLPIIKLETEKSSTRLNSNIDYARGTETVLIAEDDEALRKLSTTVLSEFGYKVIQAFDGEDAINKFRENESKVHLLILDVIMPKKNGGEVLKEIRKRKPDIKALFTSGYTADMASKNGMVEKGVTFVYKPVSPYELLKKVREILDNP